MNTGINLLSNIVVYTKYAKYLPQLKRRETWQEIMERYTLMMYDRYSTKEDKDYVKEQKSNIFDVDVKGLSSLSQEIMLNSKYLLDRKVLPSMRAAQFAGAAIKKNEARIYNCGYMPMSHYSSFSELMFLLLGGTGVGYSVQQHHIEQLPAIQKPLSEAKYLIGDSIEGWADAVKALMKAYFGMNKVKPRFDYTDIRDKGERLVTAGGKAPGPAPLRLCLTKIDAILEEKKTGEKLTSFEVHRINCIIADAVLAGGIRRAAMIALFSLDDTVMATSKHGNWWELYPELGRANNSAVILRNRIKKHEFEHLWKMTVDSNSGEPGVYFTNDPEYGTNPCCEIALRPYSFCNLTEINGGVINSQEEYNDYSRVASFFGTLQAGFTDFHYLRKIWQNNTEKDALIGVGITGIANGNILKYDLNEAADVAIAENLRVSKLIGIRRAARVTTIKPSGTTSCVVGTSSGIHAWHSKYYIRNIQCKVGDELYNFFNKKHPRLITVMEYAPDSAVIGIPLMAPDNAILREDETALALLQRVKRFNVKWVKPGHINGPNSNNVSATISCKPHEWYDVGEWMWENKNTFNGLSVMPYDGGSYKNAPFEVCSKEVYDDTLRYIEENKIKLTDILEEADNTSLAQELACGPDGCAVL